MIRFITFRMSLLHAASGNIQMGAVDIGVTPKERDGVHCGAWGTVKFILCVVVFFRELHMIGNCRVYCAL